MLEIMPKVVVDAKVKFLRAEEGTPNFKVDRQCPECEEAWIYNVDTKSESTTHTSKARDLSMTLEGSGNHSHASDLQALMAHAAPSLQVMAAVPAAPGGKLLTEEEKLAADEAKKKNKEELRTNKDNPVEKAKDWLKKLPMLITMAEKYLDETAGKGSMAKLAPGTTVEYKKIFGKPKSKLIASQFAMSEFLKGDPPDESQGRTLIHKADSAVAEFRQYKAAWQKLGFAYSKL